MTLIYSDDFIDGLDGAYIAPFRFDEPMVSATLVYTDDKDISKAYKDLDIEVKQITKANAKK
jgi:hypothetical protein